jgi:hypothetical protein
MMRPRDWEYVEVRLLAPATEVLNAITRLRAHGEPELANRVMAALQTFTDECRQVRYDLAAKQHGGQP